MVKCPLGKHSFVPRRVSGEENDIAYCFGDVHVYRASKIFLVDCVEGGKCATVFIRDESAALEWALFEAVDKHGYGSNEVNTIS